MITFDSAVLLQPADELKHWPRIVKLTSSTARNADLRGAR
jgi:hypothetical protein